MEGGRRDRAREMEGLERRRMFLMIVVLVKINVLGSMHFKINNNSFHQKELTIL